MLQLPNPTLVVQSSHRQWMNVAMFQSNFKNCEISIAYYFYVSPDIVRWFFSTIKNLKTILACGHTKTGGVIRQFCLIPLGECKNFVEQVREFTNTVSYLKKLVREWGFMSWHSPFLVRRKRDLSQSILSSLHPQKILNLLPNFQINEISFKNLDFGLLLKMSNWAYILTWQH